MTARTATIAAWLPGHQAPDALRLLTGDDVTLINGLGYSTVDMSSAGWVRVGTAQITVTLESHDAMTAAAVDALRRKQGELQAECTQIERQIQSLLAITLEPKATGEQS